jgi:hypothetical protein
LQASRASRRASIAGCRETATAAVKGHADDDPFN